MIDHWNYTPDQRRELRQGLIAGLNAALMVGKIDLRANIERALVVLDGGQYEGVPRSPRDYDEGYMRDFEAQCDKWGCD